MTQIKETLDLIQDKLYLALVEMMSERCDWAYIKDYIVQASREVRLLSETVLSNEREQITEMLDEAVDMESE